MTMSEVDTASLKENKVFRDLDEEILELFLKVGRIKQFSAGETIYERGQESGGRCGFVISGTVNILTAAGQLLKQLGRSEVLGEIGATSPQAKRTVTVVAKENTIFLEWDLHQLERMFSTLLEKLKSQAWKNVSYFTE